MITKTKKLLYVSMWYVLSASLAFSASPVEDCWWHPICGTSWWDGVFTTIGEVIALGIRYVAVIAVIAVMIGGIMYLISWGQEEKTKQAKNIIIWALVGTFLSVSAWWLISIVNNFRLF